jgi:multidrug transporter EmrE-like cation transporter
LTIISFLIFDISILHRIKFIDTESKITYTSIGKGFIAIIAIYLFYQRISVITPAIRMLVLVGILIVSLNR